MRLFGFWFFVIMICLEVGCLQLEVLADSTTIIPQLDFVDATVVDVVETLARSADLDLVLAGDQTVALSKKATIHLKEITIEEAIEAILRTNGFNYEKKGKVLLVSLLPQDILPTAYKNEMETYQLKYLSAVKAAEILIKIMPNTTFQAASRSNLLILRGRGSEIKEAKELLSSIDQLSPQILIESKVIELSQSDSIRLGISYGNGVYKFITNKITKKTSPADDLVSTLNALITDGKADVIANPRIATLDNQEALINIGDRIPYAVPVSSSGVTTQWTVEYIDAGVKLKITPQLGDKGVITTFIQPEVSAISEWRTTAAGEFPVISTRNASATVRIKDGETIIIGGLLSEGKRENVTRVPILGQIPIVGLLFTNRTIEKEKTEIVFLITPHVI
jgi:type II secretory pathway component GspD/PulD (secretin)